MWGPRTEPATSMLPKPDGLLLQVIPPSSIIAAINKEVKKVLDLPTGPRAEEIKTTSKRGMYDHFTLKEKARIEKKVAEHGVTATIRYFSKLFPGRLRKVLFEHKRKSSFRKLPV